MLKCAFELSCRTISILFKIKYEVIRKACKKGCYQDTKMLYCGGLVFF